MRADVRTGVTPRRARRLGGGGWLLLAQEASGKQDDPAEAGDDHGPLDQASGGVAEHAGLVQPGENRGGQIAGGHHYAGDGRVAGPAAPGRVAGEAPGQDEAGGTEAGE